MSGVDGARRVGPRPPAGLVVAALLVLLEALAIAVYAVLSLVAAPASPYPTTAFGVGGTALITALLLLAVCVALLRGRAWARTAALVWQVVQLLVGVYALQGQGAQPAFAISAIAPAVVVLLLLLSRPVREATARG